MFVNAPRLPGPGPLVSNTTYQANLARADGLGYLSPEDALNNAYNLGYTSSPIVYAQSERANMTSGIIGYKVYKNTAYRASYMRRYVEDLGVTICRSKVNPKYYYAEAAPLGLGYTGFFNTGLGEFTGSINPWGTALDAYSVYNRTVIANLQRRGIVECKQKMLESKMDLAESLVDLDKTVLLICRRAMQVLTAWKQVRKKDFKGAARTLGISKRNLNFNTAAEAWLEFIYAWRPLLSDVFSAVEVIKDAFGDPLKHHTYAKRRVAETLWVQNVPGSAYWANVQNTHDSVVQVETKFRFRVSNSLLAYITGFQLSNPLYVLWVSVPLTFVVDWFLPIGDWLGSLTATHGLEFVDGYQTTKTWASVRVQGNRNPNYSTSWNVFRYHKPGRSRVEAGYIQRSTFTTWPMSYTYFRFPFTSPERIASAIALTKATAKLR